jgi:hypothetical protein
MQVRKGVRRIGALMLVLLATGAMADTPGAVEVPSPEAQAEILNLLERQALYRDRVDWPATRVRLQSAQGDPRNGWPFCAKPLRSARATMAVDDDPAPARIPRARSRPAPPPWTGPRPPMRWMRASAGWSSRAMPPRRARRRRKIPPGHPARRAVAAGHPQQGRRRALWLDRRPA